MSNKELYLELVNDYGKEINVFTAEEWIDVKAYGTYEMDYKNGELWSYNGKLYLLEFIYLPLKEKEIINDTYTNYNI